jgi:hypothetical protein
MAEASAGVWRLRPVPFRYRQPRADGTRPLQYGLIAEEQRTIEALAERLERLERRLRD